MNLPIHFGLKFLVLGVIIIPAKAFAATLEPSVTLTKSIKQIVIAPAGTAVPSECSTSATTLDLRVSTAGFKGRNVESNIVVTGGRVVMAKNKFLWDLTGSAPGSYIAMVNAKSNKGETARNMTSIEVAECK